MSGYQRRSLADRPNARSTCSDYILAFYDDEQTFVRVSPRALAFERLPT